MSEHPSLFLPDNKEVHFFDENYENYEKGLDWYGGHFCEAGNRVVGEITPNYYHNYRALDKIKNDLPDIKIIFILREPISRAYSQYQLYKQKYFKDLDFYEVINTNDGIKDHSLQGKYLRYISSVFPKENLHVIYYDEINDRPDLVIKNVFSFVGVEDSFVPESLGKRVNRVVFPDAQDFLKKIGCTWLIEFIKKTPLAEKIKNIAHKHKKENIYGELKDSVKDEFLKDIEVIESIQKKDLSAWKCKLKS